MSAPGESGREALNRVWAQPRGWRYFSEVNNTAVGLWYLAAGLGFFAVAGVLALLMRLQLAWPWMGFLGPEAYNQVFTMHGTIMMVVFAVPIMEAVAVYVLPQMLGVRDLPFPRLSSYGFWCYLLGGLLLLSSFLFGPVPNGGWFMYTPLSGPEYTPGLNTDFWLLGLTFIEISAVAACIELIVGIMKTRAPGMSLDRMPILGWAFLTVAVMILFAFPPLLLGDVLLEAERVLDWPFFDAGRGGDPLLWQHLFWFFGHPEVYIIFLPGAAMVSTILPTFCGRPLVGHQWVVVATIATGILSFGLWVHHMFAAGIPLLSLSLFSAASMAVAIPSGIQVFAWLATLWGARPRWDTPFLFVIGFLVIFVIGGLTGVMVASVPFDWQVTDTHFVVAHFHYVLIGGAIFPLFGALTYWFPLPSGRLMDETVGKWSFWLMFVGFNVTFFPLHVLGLLGMPRRVYTYPGGLGWEWLNLTATIGAFVLGAGVAVFFANLAWSWKRGRPAGHDPWKAGTLEWAGPTPLTDSGGASVPRVRSLHPLWDQPAEMAAAARGEALMCRPTTHGRETLRVSAVSAEPQQVIQVSGPGWSQVAAAAATAVMFGAGTFHLWGVAAAGGVVTLALLTRWAWHSDRQPPMARVDIGQGIVVPTYAADHSSHAWWAAVVAVLFDGAAYLALLSAYVFLWLVNPVWPPPPWEGRIALGDILAGGGMLAVAAVLAHAGAGLHRRGRHWALPAGLGGAVAVAVAVAWTGLSTLTAADLGPTRHAFPATVWVMALYTLVHLGVATLLALLVLARQAAGLVTPVRRMTVMMTVLAWDFAAFTGLASMAMLVLWPATGGGGGICTW